VALATMTLLMLVFFLLALARTPTTFLPSTFSCAESWMFSGPHSPPTGAQLSRVVTFPSPLLSVLRI